MGLCCRAPEADNTKIEIKLPIQVLWLLTECIQVIIQHVVLCAYLYDAALLITDQKKSTSKTDAKMCSQF